MHGITRYFGEGWDICVICVVNPNVFVSYYPVRKHNVKNNAILNSWFLIICIAFSNIRHGRIREICVRPDRWALYICPRIAQRCLYRTSCHLSFFVANLLAEWLSITNVLHAVDVSELLSLLGILLTMYWFKWRCHANDAGALYRVIITVRKIVKKIERHK